MDAKITRATERSLVELAPGAKIHRDVDDSISESMSCSILEMENFELEWTVLYDEYLYVLEGTLTIELKDGTYDLKTGDSLWMPDGTWHFYHTKQAKVLVTVYPANWQKTRNPD